VGLRVLIAEDEAIIRLDLRETLEEEGYEVAGETGRGDEAVAMARELAPDLAVLDIGMPGMDGLEACRAIRAQAGGDSIQIAAVSGWGQADDHRRSREAGFDAHLVKPVERAALAALLASAPY